LFSLWSSFLRPVFLRLFLSLSVTMYRDNYVPSFLLVTCFRPDMELFPPFGCSHFTKGIPILTLTDPPSTSVFPRGVYVLPCPAYLSFKEASLSRVLFQYFATWDFLPGPLSSRSLDFFLFPSGTGLAKMGPLPSVINVDF